ncbi:MAG TPA: YceI family protein [Polyangiaceae bacterium]|nr:YceI family protein [Polyangiaceae bacterium]
MQSRKHLWMAAATCGMVSVSAMARATLSAASDSHVGFVASGPAGMSIEGTTSDLSLADQGDNVVITVPLANLTTGISLRDRHMKDKYLEVQKYPAATLTVARAALKLPSGGDKIEADVPSTLSLHGQSRPVVVRYEVKKDGASLSARGKFHVNMQDFGITVPTYLGITVKPDVDVNANFRVAGN